MVFCCQVFCVSAAHGILNVHMSVNRGRGIATILLEKSKMPVEWGQVSHCGSLRSCFCLLSLPGRNFKGDLTPMSRSVDDKLRDLQARPVVWGSVVTYVCTWILNTLELLCSPWSVPQHCSWKKECNLEGHKDYIWSFLEVSLKSWWWMGRLDHPRLVKLPKIFITLLLSSRSHSVWQMLPYGSSLCFKAKQNK